MLQWPRKTKEEIFKQIPQAFSQEVLQQTQTIISDIIRDKDVALRKYGEQFQELSPGDAFVCDPVALKKMCDTLPQDQRALLERTQARIEQFAQAQLACLQPLTMPVASGFLGHELAPIERVGCYAPGGRFPLPSSVLMTVVTARVAGVKHITVASPKPTPITLAAASIAGADLFVRTGGAHTIAALAYGTETLNACNFLCGPGNAWVTAAKYIVSKHVGIDMLAGPSELVVIADDSASAKIIAADLLAQAEHDDLAVPILISLSPNLLDEVTTELTRQLKTLPTNKTAEVSLSQQGFAVVAKSEQEAVEIANFLAPEHLQLHVKNIADYQGKLQHYGALFLGENAAEVLADYGIGPNHVLPTGGSSRYRGGLSVFSFLRIRTWMQADATPANNQALQDAADLARLEGLEAHARAALARKH